MNLRREALRLLGFGGMVTILSGKNAEAVDEKKLRGTVGIPTDGEYYLTTIVTQLRPDGRPLSSPTGIGVAYDEGKRLDVFVRSQDQWKYGFTIYTTEELGGEPGPRNYEAGRWTGTIRGAMSINAIRTTLSEREVSDGGLRF